VIQTNANLIILVRSYFFSSIKRNYLVYTCLCNFIVAVTWEKLSETKKIIRKKNYHSSHRFIWSEIYWKIPKKLILFRNQNEVVKLIFTWTHSVVVLCLPDKWIFRQQIWIRIRRFGWIERFQHHYRRRCQRFVLPKRKTSTDDEPFWFFCPIKFLYKNISRRWQSSVQFF
jgi:hypothetical protein